MEIRITGSSEDFAVLLMTLMDKEKNSPEGEHDGPIKSSDKLDVEPYEMLINAKPQSIR